MSNNDRKFYLNIFENLPDKRIRFWLQIGFSQSRRDTYIFDPRLAKDVHFSVHRDGNVHIRNGKKSTKYVLFSSPWIVDPDPTHLKQFIYFRPADESYPIVDAMPETPATINHAFTFHDAATLDHTIYQNIVFKILLGPPTATTYKQHHRDINGDPDTFKHDHWIIGIKPMNLLPRASHDNGTFVWFFNTITDIPDSQLFTGNTFEIGPETLNDQFIISHRKFAEGEVTCVYYRL